MKLNIDVMRHANSLKVPGLQDLYRPLSEKGIEQAVAARSRYSNSERVALVIHSPAPRALCTAAIAVGEARPKYICLDSLWVEPNDVNWDGPIIWEAFEKYGYELERYLTDLQQALHRFGTRTAMGILEIISEQKWHDGDVIIVAGHAIFSNFTAFYLAGAGKEAEELLHTPFGEAGRMRLVFVDGKCTGVCAADTE